MLEKLDIVIAFAAVMLLLSLLVTVVVQMVLAALGLRARNLVWGVSRLLRQIEPELTEKLAGEVSKALLAHPALSHTIGRPTTAISKEEFVRLLNDLATNPAVSLSDEARKVVGDYLNKTVGEETVQRAKAVVAVLAPEVAAGAAAVEAQIAGLAANVQKVIADTAAWFDTVLNRSSERFMLHTRFVIAGVALAGAFVLHVDSLGILKQLATSEEVRGQIVRSVADIDQRAKGILEQTPIATLAVRATIEALKDKIPVPGAVPPLATRQQGADWLAANIADKAGLEEALRVYEARFEAETGKALARYAQDYTGVKNQVASLSLQIVPAPLPPFSRYWDDRRHLLGTLMSVLLLSLGAPFWYNALRQLSTLRPLVAQKVDPKR